MSKLEPSQIVIAVDTREQLSYEPEFHSMGFKTQRVKLDHGDYSAVIPGLLKTLTVERKSLSDAISSTASSQRARFTRELHCLRAYKYPFVVIEASLSQILAGDYRSKANPISVVSSFAKWQSSGISFILADTREAAALVTAKLIYHVANEIFAYCSKLFSIPSQPAPALEPHKTPIAPPATWPTPPPHDEAPPITIPDTGRSAGSYKTISNT